MSDVYKIEIDVSTAEGVKEEKAKSGDIITTTDKKSLVDKTRDLVGKDRFNQIRNVSAGGAVIGAAGLTVYEQNAKFKGDSNTIAQVGEIKKWGGRGLAVTGLLATGRFAAAGLYIGYTAFNLALENRQLIHDRAIDTYSSNYYQQRLIYDVSGRSR